MRTNAFTCNVWSSACAPAVALASLTKNFLHEQGKNGFTQVPRILPSSTSVQPVPASSPTGKGRYSGLDCTPRPATEPSCGVGCLAEAFPQSQELCCRAFWPLQEVQGFWLYPETLSCTACCPDVADPAPWQHSAVVAGVFKAGVRVSHIIVLHDAVTANAVHLLPLVH